MNRRKFFGFLFGATAVGAVAPKELAKKIATMDEMLRRSEDLCRIDSTMKSGIKIGKISRNPRQARE